jgi:glutaminyl-tRNA synthetase
MLTYSSPLIQQKAKPKAFLHWLSAEEAIGCEVRLYGPLFTCHDPNEFDNFLDKLNPNSLVAYKDAKMSKSLLNGLKHLSRYCIYNCRFQFERKGFFAVDYDSKLEEGKVIWNLTVGLLQDKDKDK